MRGKLLGRLLDKSALRSLPPRARTKPLASCAVDLAGIVLMRSIRNFDQLSLYESMTHASRRAAGGAGRRAGDGRATGNAGMRISAARRLVIEAVYEAETPVSAEQIAAGLGGRLPESVLSRCTAISRPWSAPVWFATSTPDTVQACTRSPRVERNEYLVCESSGGCTRRRTGRARRRPGADPFAFGFEARFSHFPIVGLRVCARASGRSGERQWEVAMAAVNFEFLFRPDEELDPAHGLFDGRRCWWRWDHVRAPGSAPPTPTIVAVTSLVAADGGDARARLAWAPGWGSKLPRQLFAIGIPLIAFKSEPRLGLSPEARRRSACDRRPRGPRDLKWFHGDFRAGRLRHAPAAADTSTSTDGHRPSYLRRGAEERHAHRPVRTPTAVGIGMLHGLAGRGPSSCLPALPSQLEASLALAVFALMSIVSMATCTTAFAWLLTRP